MSELDCGFIRKLKIWIEKIKCVVQPSQEEIPVQHLGAWDLCQYIKC